MSFVSGDTGSKLQVTCKDDDTGTAIDLTGSTVQLQWKDRSGTFVEKTMTVTDAANGVAEYQFAAGELFAKKMLFEVEITDSSGNVIRSLSLLEEDVRSALS